MLAYICILINSSAQHEELIIVCAIDRKLTVVQKLFEILVSHMHVRSQDLGGQEYFFQNWKFACCEARGVRGHAPPRIFLKWCNLVRFGVYFDPILSLKFFKNYHFFI